MMGKKRKRGITLPLMSLGLGAIAGYAMAKDRPNDVNANNNGTQSIMQSFQNIGKQTKDE